jgi:hypothetical protein
MGALCMLLLVQSSAQGNNMACLQPAASHLYDQMIHTSSQKQQQITPMQWTAVKSCSQVKCV